MEMTTVPWLPPRLAAAMIPRAVPGGTAEGVISGDKYAVHWGVPFSVILKVPLAKPLCLPDARVSRPAASRMDDAGGKAPTVIATTENTLLEYGLAS